MPKYFLATKHYPRRAPPFPKKNQRPKFEFKHEEAKYRVDLKRDLRVRRIQFNKEAKTEILEKTHERVVGETYPRVTVMGGLFSNLLTSPCAILLDNDQARKISSVVDMNGGPKEIVRVMYLTGRDAGKIEKVRLGSLNADMYEKTPMTLKEAKDVAAKNLKRVKLQEFANSRAVTRDQVVAIAAKMRKDLHASPDGLQLMSHGLFKDSVLQITVKMPEGKRTSQNQVKEAVRNAGYKGELETFLLGRIIEVNFVVPGQEKARDELREIEAEEDRKSRNDLARRRRQDKKSDQLQEDLKKRNLPGAFILGYDDAVRSTDPNNVNFDKAFDPSKPEEMAKRIINSFGDPKIQVQQYVEGVRAYVKAKKEGKDVSKPLDWLL